MFDAVMLDVAIGLLLLFLVASVAAAAIVEAVGGFLHRRSKNLWDTISILLGQTELDGRSMVDRLYRQPGVKALVRPTDRIFWDPATDEPKVRVRARSKPPRAQITAEELTRRYYGPKEIDARTFAESLLDVFRPGGAATATLDQIEAQILQLPEGDLRTQLLGLLARAGNEVDDFQAAIEDWYERFMTSVSSWYRKQTRWFLFAAGLGLAVVGNLDAIGAGATLYRDDSVRQAVVAEAIKIETAKCDTPEPAEDEGDDSPAEGSDEDGESPAVVDLTDCIRAEVDDAVSLPIGWSGFDSSTGAWAWRLVGWFMVATATTLGGPFWFDLLRRVLNVRRGGRADG